MYTLFSIFYLFFNDDLENGNPMKYHYRNQQIQLITFVT